jgi:hypothetical protein
MNTMGVRSNIYSSCYGSIKYYVDKLAIRDIKETMYDEDKLKNNENIYANMIETMQTFMDND